MSQELFYTSAPKGLRPGSQGFCTVAATRGLSAALVEKLESLSGYRPLYPPHDARAGRNPVACAHVRLNAGGKTYTVLSRIGPAGLDYTERPNKFAHHVVLDPAELPAGGPAWLLRQPGFLESRWDGQVQVLTAGRLPPRGDAAPDVCRSWQALTGDAGWGGVPAEAFQADPTRLVYLVFEPGMDLLALLAESLALLPPEQRWEVTFSTYFTGLPQGAQCLWRCVPRGSPEAKGARQFPNALILDLGYELGAARGGALVARARGQAFVPPPIPGKEPGWSDPFADGLGGELPRFDTASPIGRHQSSFGGNLVQEAPGVTTPPPPPLPDGNERRGTGKRRLLLGVGGGALAGAAVTAALMGGYLGFSGHDGIIAFGNAKDDQGVKSEPAKEKEAEVEKGKTEGAALKALAGQLDESRNKNEVLAKQLAASKEKGEGLAGELDGIKKEKKSLSEAVGELRKKVANLNKQLADLRKKMPKDPDPPPGPPPGIELVPNNLALPVLDSSSGVPPLVLKDVSSTDSSKYKLNLRGLDRDVNADAKLVTQSGDGDLTITLKHQDAGAPVRLAHFWLEGSKLHFEWGNKSGLKRGDLHLARRKVRNSVLEIQGPDPMAKPVYVGLILARPPEKLWVFPFGKENPFKLPLPFDKERKPLHKLAISSARCEIQSGSGDMTGKDNRIDFQRQDDVVLRVTSEADEKYYLTAQWKGKNQPPPTLLVKRFIVYMVVDGLNVAVLRVGKDKD